MRTSCKKTSLPFSRGRYLSDLQSDILKRSPIVLSRLRRRLMRIVTQRLKQFISSSTCPRSLFGEGSTKLWFEKDPQIIEAEGLPHKSWARGLIENVRIP